MIKNSIILCLLCCVVSTTAAQSNKKDTVVLSVYNNNQRFMLYPMPFGKNKPDRNNKIGQSVTNYQLPYTQTGKLDINVTAWQNGTYNVRLTSRKFVEMKRMIVVH